MWGINLFDEHEVYSGMYASSKLRAFDVFLCLVIVHGISVTSVPEFLLCLVVKFGSVLIPGLEVLLS